MSTSLITLVGKHTGWFEAFYSMKVSQEDYDKFLADNPGYSMDEDPDTMWNYFKQIGYNDEIEDSCDYDTVLREIEVGK